MAIERSNLKDSMYELNRKIDDLQKAISRIEKLEREEIEHINSVKDMESEELRGISDIESLENSEIVSIKRLKPLRFADIMSWKNAIWENCGHKILIDSKKLVLFNCSITSKICSYGGCPQNILDVEK